MQVEYMTVQMEKKRRSPLGIRRRYVVPAAVPVAYGWSICVKGFRGISSPLARLRYSTTLDPARPRGGAV